MGIKIVSIVGARPQFIKAAPVSRLLRQCCTEILVHTGQHYDEMMSAVFFEELGIIPPDHNLGVGSATHGVQTGKMLSRIEQILLGEQPDWVLIYGDTNSTLAGALAAAKLHLRVAHVEAGLRSFNRAMPEEINRVVADHVSDLLLCPSQTAADNLAAEGISRGVHVVGDVMADALALVAGRVEKNSDTLSNLGINEHGYLLATVHRAENVSDAIRLGNILTALAESEEPIVFPVHPRTRKALEDLSIGSDSPLTSKASNLRLIEPVGYLEMIRLERSARLILTDSGGIQKEAYWLGVPCVTLRDETEWVETVEAGWNVLVGADTESIRQAIRSFSPPPTRQALYGAGEAAPRVVDLLLSTS